MIKPEHTKDGKVKPEHRSRYHTKDIEKFETKEPKTQMEALILILKELKKITKKII